MGQYLSHKPLYSFLYRYNSVFETTSHHPLDSDKYQHSYIYPLFLSDVLFEIFSHLDNYTVYFRCANVCKTWRYCAWYLLNDFKFRYDENLEFLISGKDVDLQQSTPGPKGQKNMYSQIVRSNKLYEARNQMLEKLLDHVVCNAKYLKKFQVLDAQQHDAFNKMITNARIEHLTNSCSDLLDTIDLTACNYLKENAFLNISKKCGPNLVYLKLRYSTSIHDVLCERYISKMKKLKYLNLSKCPYVGLYGLLHISTGCTSLEALDVSGCLAIPNFSFLNNFSNLKELYIQDTLFSSNDVQYIPSTLEKLNIRRSDNLKQLDLSKIAHLKEIDISYCSPLLNINDDNNIQIVTTKWEKLSAVSNEWTEKLVSISPNLKELEIGFLKFETKEQELRFFNSIEHIQTKVVQ
ncbi:hypothetical protein C9374_007032 [Naegleria lovaniensis]|uniref:F-box domain-containing protein n=1 Tax=Naegleria lovaniensis TaxID=51637 RepID=A0AA88KRQ7_NAELO|nr:uncharacterized protein C9374_007032 [Naegleria lovaniensis]KAG2393501.1 hypothetical protein C9374_007032 [Naegleria lovaniensis]